MPYAGERASKVSHINIVDNPTVAAFHEACHYLKAPSPEEAASIAVQFVEPPPHDAVALPARVVAIDGSWHEGSLDEHLLPSTRIGYVQIGGVLVDLRQLSSLRVREDRFVDPFAVARLDENNDRLIFPVPSSNVTYRGLPSVRASFRLAVEEHLASPATWTRAGDPSSSLLGTLLMLTALRAGDLGTGDPNRVLLSRCPNAGCAEERVGVTSSPAGQVCPACGGPVFVSDVLRIWENVTDYQSNGEAFGRLMNAVEQLLFVHYIRSMVEARSFETLAQTAFFMDGPLAVFGNMAWLHAPILSYLLDVNRLLGDHQLPGLLVIGLQKTGQLADYTTLMADHIPPNRVMCITDSFRYGYISPRDEAAITFGLETHYGQDFLYKTPSGRFFPFALPYPVTKDPRAEFAAHKADATRYANLPRALKLINLLESDLYENATIPIVLAHRYTAISLVPGGKVLDLLSRERLTVEPPAQN
jgi:NurA domain